MPSMHRLMLAAAVVGGVANGYLVPLPFPTPTSVAQNHCAAQGWTPKPTTAPDSPFYWGNAFDLVRRQSSVATSATVETCGYVDGIQSLPWLCSAGSVCYYNSVTSVWGCCDAALASCTHTTKCLNYGATGLLESLGSETVSCVSSNAPDCLLVVSTLGSAYYENYFCTNTPNLGVFLDSTYGSNLDFIVTLTGLSSSAFISPTVTSTSSTSTKTTSSSTTSSSSSISSSTSTSTSTSTSSSSTPTQTGSGGLSAGAKAGIGGGVGGAAALVIIGVLVCCLMMKKKKKKKENSTTDEQRGVQGAYGGAPGGQPVMAYKEQQQQQQQPQSTPPPHYAGQASGYPQQPKQDYTVGAAAVAHPGPTELDGRHSMYSQSAAPMSPMSAVSSNGVPSPPLAQPAELHSHSGPTHAQLSELHAQSTQPAEKWAGERSGPIELA